MFWYSVEVGAGHCCLVFGGCLVVCVVGGCSCSMFAVVQLSSVVVLVGWGGLMC